MRTRGFLSLLLLAVASVGSSAADNDGSVFFEKQIRPVLVEHCYECHSVETKKQRGGLHLDTRAALLKGGDSGPAIVPGKPNESLLIKAVRYTAPDMRMPPKKKLPAAVVADLEKWVALGAPDPRTGSGPKVAGNGWDLEKGKRFWSFQPPRQHSVPAVKDAAWPRGNIDRFLLASLESKGLRPAPDASRADLIRRAYYALIGLPPTPAEVDAFVKDRTPGAFARVVDRLLASPHFGERWGRHWLDVARYADSSGGGRSLIFRQAWRYRDYVINAFNSDKPYDRFILEQIAGDLLEARTPEEQEALLIATALLLLGPHNYERQDKPGLEMDIIDEQIDTIGKAFLGMTVGCARCHDHKFDPISHKDYYALAGILKSTKWIVHANVSNWTERPLPVSGKLAQAVKEHEAAVAALRRELEQVRAAEKKAGKVVAAKGKGALDPRLLPGIVIDDSQARVVGSWKHSVFSGTFVGKGYLFDERGKKEDKTLTFIPEIPQSGFYEVRLAYVPSTNRATNVPVRIFHTDGEVTVRVNQRLTPPIDGYFVSLGRYRFEKGSQWFVMVSTEKADGHVIADAVQFLPDDAQDEPKPARKAPAPVKAKAPAVTSRALEARLKKLIASGPQRPMAMAVSEADKVEDCFICIRGNIHNRGPKVSRGLLEALIPAGATAPGGRLHIPAKESGRRQLAAWLASPENPLTARVMANRVWHHLFGAGLVRTVDNFGLTGELPSHPELLDHLALRFVEQGWSVKKLIRAIMLSRAYQMGTEPASPEVAQLAKKVDPDNRLLWKMPRRRLDAESIRDTILVVSGQLDRAAGGVSIRAGTVAERDYKFEDARRSVYTPIFRNRVLELFEVFDFANPNVCNGQRVVSTVPTQALYLMNSPFVQEQARLAADRFLARADVADAGRVEHAYRVALGRLPTDRERRLALEFLAGAAADQRRTAWGQLVQALFGCVDFRYVN
ncbi:MAG: DUF1553 domain-containing protein [Gemmataceae bacterium]|nr:DUF1553 domain-containing protein [Gemmataceae bacterium]